MFCYISKTELNCLIYYKANVLPGKSLNALKLNTGNTNNPLFKLKGTDLKVTSASKTAAVMRCHDSLLGLELKLRCNDYFNLPKLEAATAAVLASLETEISKLL
ncbi:MAG: hypothetical protein ACKESB_00270 [Candidatus Hodgkinia cicadicola]